MDGTEILQQQRLLTRGYEKGRRWTKWSLTKLDYEHPAIYNWGIQMSRKVRNVGIRISLMKVGKPGICAFKKKHLQVEPP